MVAERVIGGVACGEVLALLGEYLDGALGPEALAAVTAHVSACSQCERFGGAYATVVKALRETPAEAPLEESAVSAIVAGAGR